MNRVSMRWTRRGAAAVAVAVAGLALAGCGSSGESADLAAGEQTFKNLCSSCHTLEAAGTPPAHVGPSLDDSFRAARQVGMSDSQFKGVVHRWIEIAQQPMPRNLVTGADAENVAAGVYRMPSDHFESPVAMLSRARRFLADASRVRERRARKSNSEVLTPDRHGRFPRYYLQNFHYQTDGYLSPESAALYDHQVEILFGGGADAMRRQALPPIAAHLRAACAGGRRIKDLSLADIACGTGKFLVAVKENYPRLPVTGIELSPDYVAEARRRLEPWSWTRLLEANAERLPLADRSQDVATCIYLFHELPRQVRSRVASEIARILKPGGLFVFVDSIQKGDHAPFDALLDAFPIQFHEPYYADFVRSDLPALFAAAGFRVESIERAFMSRVMTLRRV